MGIGLLETEGDLEQWFKRMLERMGIRAGGGSGSPGAAGAPGIGASFPAWSDDFSSDLLSTYKSGTDTYGDAYPPAFVVSGGQLGISPTQGTGERLLLRSDISLGHPRVDCKVSVAGEPGGVTLFIVLLWLNKDTDPANMPPVAPSTELVAPLPTEFHLRDGLAGVGVYPDTASRTTKLDDLKIGMA
jgi:hypothetical protein